MHRFIPFVAVCALALAGCSEERATRAQTIDETSHSAVQPSVDPTPVPEPEEAPREQLTQEQVNAALLTVTDMPSG